jgi:tetratricopeptide (TPR) repeat protein
MTKVRLLTLVSIIVLLGALAGCRSAHTTSAILYIEQENYQKAIDVIDEGLSYEPEDPEAYFWQGESYSHMAEKAIEVNDYVKARECYTQAYTKYSTARQMNPELMADRVRESLEINYENRLRDGDRMWQSNHFEQAEGFYRLANAALPDSISPLTKAASMKMAMSVGVEEDSAKVLMADALKYLDAVLVKSPNAYKVQADKAYALTFLGRLDEAGAMCETLLVQHGDDPELLVDASNFLLRQKDFRRAADLNVKIADIYSKDANVENDAKIVGLLTDAGNVYASRDVQAYPEAVAAFEKANELDPLSKDILFYRLRTYYFYGQDLELKAEAAEEPKKAELRAQAQDMFRRGAEVGNALVSFATDHADGYQFLAMCQFKLGQTAEGEANMAKSTALAGGGSQ